MIKTPACILFLLISAGINLAQDSHYSQFYAAPLSMNPALTGAEICPRIVLNYRDQSPVNPLAYNTYSFAFDRFVPSLHGGFGFFLTNDRQADGIINSLHLAFCYSYAIPLSDKLMMRTGFQGGLIQRSYHPEKMVFPDMLNPNGQLLPSSETPASGGHTLADFSAGLVFYSRKFYLGGAIHHINQPGNRLNHFDQAIYPIRYTLHLGGRIDLFHHGLVKERLSLNPGVIFLQQQQFSQLNYGISLARKLLNVGIWLRNDLRFENHTYIFSVGFVLSKLKIAYTYDLNSSRLLRQLMTAHEVSLAWKLSCKTKERKYKPVPCPEF